MVRRRAEDGGRKNGPSERAANESRSSRDEDRARLKGQRGVGGPWSVQAGVLG